jgi:hypothetical protein
MLNNLDAFEIANNEDIGEGAYSKVFKAHHKETGAIYALKKVD